MAALDIRQKISPNQSFYQREKNWDPYKTYLSTITTRWWHWLAWNLRLLAPNLPFSSLPHTASLSLLSVNSWITHDDFMYPTYGTSSRILSWPLLTAKQEMSPNIWDHWSIQYGCWPSIFFCVRASFPLLMIFHPLTVTWWGRAQESGFSDPIYPSIL